MAHTPHTWTNGDVIAAAPLNQLEADLAAAADGAAVTAAQAFAVQRGNHTGTQTADTVTDGTANKAYTAGEKTKLAGVATGATVNRADSAVDTLLAAKADLVGGVIPTSQIPALALNTAVTVANQAAMLALTTAQVQPGDVAVRTDGAGTFILTATDPTQFANWTRLNAPTDVVTTVNGQQGTVVLAKADVGLGNVDNTADANKPISTAQATAIGNTTLNLPVNVITTNATAVIGARNSVNASAGPLTIALPTPTAVGQHLIIERADTSSVTANVITVTGTVRGAASTVVLNPVGAAFEGALYIAESLTSWAIASSIKPRAVLDAAYDAKGAAAAVTPTTLGLQATKRVTHAFGAARASVAAAVVTDWAERVPIVLPVKTTRWRLRAANVSQLDGTIFTTPWTVGTIYFGQPASPGTGRGSGIWAATPATAAAGGTVPIDGTDFISAWVTDPAAQFNPNQMSLVGYTLATVGGGSGTVVKTNKNLFRNSAAGGAASIATTGVVSGYNGNTGALDIRLEYEFVGSNPVGLFVGDSITEGYNSDSTDTLQSMIHESWPGAFSLAKRIAVINAGIIGCTESPFLSATTFGLKRFDLATTVPDFAVIALGSNSAAAGTAIGTIESNIVTIIATLQGLGIQRIYLATVTPRNFTNGGANETIRTTLNTWIGTVPAGVAGIIDFDQLVRDPTNLYQMQAEIVNTDGIHPKRLGYQRMAARVHL